MADFDARRSAADAWVTAMGSPDVEWAAADLASTARDLDETSVRLARTYDLVLRAGDTDLLAHAEAAHTSTWRLAEGLAQVAADLTRVVEEGR
jgi:hypothetical protein